MEGDVEKAPYHNARIWPVHIYQQNKISKMETVPQVTWTLVTCCCVLIGVAITLYTLGDSDHV